MRTYLVGRALLGMVTIAFVLVAVFLATHSLGDPVRIVLGPGASDSAVEAMRERLGFNDSLLVQMGRFLWGLVHGDLGESLWQGKPALQLVLERLPATFQLALAAMGIAIVVALGLAAICAVRPYSKLDAVGNFLMVASLSMLEFWLGLMLILVVAVALGWLPTSGYGDVRHLVLPAVTLSFRAIGRIAQVARAAMIDELNRPYVVALRARGLSEGLVTMHAMRNAGILVLTMSGLELVRLFAGATVVVETVFGWPGIGSLAVWSILNRDWPVIVAVSAVAGIVVVVMHIVIDLLYAWLNPRVRIA